MKKLKLTLTATGGDLDLGVGFVFDEPYTKECFLKQSSALVEGMKRKLDKEKVFD